MVLSILAYPASLLMGVSLGLIGAGGSILTVPILVYLLGVSAVLSTSYSLIIVGLTALLGALIAHQNKEVDWNFALFLGVPSILAVSLTRAWLMPLIPETMNVLGLSIGKDALVLIVFSMLMILAAVSMLRGPRTSSNIKTPPKTRSKAFLLVLTLEGLIVGVITGFVGAGGGFLIIPALVYLGGLDMKKAVGTSLMIIALKSLLGVLAEGQELLNLNFVLLLSISGLSLVGMLIGIRFRKNVSTAGLKKGFAYFVLVMGTAILLKELL